MRRFGVILAVTAMLAAVMATGCVFASDVDYDKRAVMGEAMTEQTPGSIELFSSTNISKYTKSNYKYVAKGIDVSKWNGTINWSKAKAAGVDYAIIRVGYYTSNGAVKDKKMDEYVKACEKYNIPYGFYIYSYAKKSKSVDRVGKEIYYTKKWIKGTHPTYPVYYDLEDKIVRAEGKTFINNAAVRFCKEIKAAGYKSGVYASLSWWNSYLTSSTLNSYEKWIAQWNSKCTYKKSYGMWQRTSNCYVPGIGGRVDLDFAYKTYSGDTLGKWGTDEEGKTVFLLKIDGSYETVTEDGETIPNIAKSRWITYNSKPYYLDENGHKLKGLVTIGDKKYYFTSSGYSYKSKWISVNKRKYYVTSSKYILKNTYKKVGSYYYGFDAEGRMMTGTSVINSKKYYFMSNGHAYLNKSKTTAKVNFRSGPGTKYKKKGTYKKGKVIAVVRTSGGWSQTSSGYWVSNKYLKKTKTYPTKVATKPTDPIKPTDPTTPDPANPIDPEPTDKQPAITEPAENEPTTPTAKPTDHVELTEGI